MSETDLRKLRLADFIGMAIGALHLMAKDVL